MKRKRGLTLFFLLGAVVLAIAVFAGNRMGDRVISQVGQRVELQPTVVPSIEATDPAADDGKRVFWKKSQIVTAATDPAFPDPRVTPPPSPTPRPATPSPKPTEEAAEPTAGLSRASASPEPTVLLTPVPPPSAVDQPGGEQSGETPAPTPR